LAVKSEVDDVPRAVCAAERPDSDEGHAPAGVELTPRGLELLEALNALFDTLSAPDDRSAR
jgi:hypothetical protein